MISFLYDILPYDCDEQDSTLVLTIHTTYVVDSRLQWHVLWWVWGLLETHLSNAARLLQTKHTKKMMIHSYLLKIMNLILSQNTRGLRTTVLKEMKQAQKE